MQTTDPSTPTNDVLDDVTSTDVPKITSEDIKQRLSQQQFEYHILMMEGCRSPDPA